MRGRGPATEQADEVRLLSIQQPWAWLIVHGEKRIENRRWRTRYRGPIAIHASLAFDHSFASGRFPLPADAELPPIATLPRGAIVGVATIIDCVAASADPWFSGPFGFVLAGVRPIEPLPWRGALGLSRLSPEAARMLLALLVPPASGGE